jgi:G6PDH family F420-dependent oxidoreductase
VLGAIAQATRRIGLATAVTCPSWRYHPAIVAQAAATVSVLAGRRLQLGLGSGERLNEHVVGAPWPSVSERQERLAEAVEIIRALFDGGTHSFAGHYLSIDQARLFDVPDEPPQILLAAGGRKAARLAARKADGLIAAEPKRKLVEAYRTAGGTGPRMVEIPMCFADSEAEALEHVQRYHRWGGLGWKVLPELPTPASFAEATRGASIEDVAADLPIGPEVEAFVEGILPAFAAGYDEIVLLQIGPAQQPFIEFFERELRPSLEHALKQQGRTS